MKLDKQDRIIDAKPCPFCGKKPYWYYLAARVAGAECLNRRCPIYAKGMSLRRWNRRAKWA